MTPESVLTYQGKAQSITDWALDYGIHPTTIMQRLRARWPVGCAITEPIPASAGDKLKGRYLDTALRKLGTRIESNVGTKRRAPEIYLTFNGQERSLSEWAKVTGIKKATLRWRFKKGWDAESTLSAPAGMQGQRQGVGSDFGVSLGTGGGTAAQETSNISFSKKEANA